MIDNRRGDRQKNTRERYKFKIGLNILLFEQVKN